MLDSGKPYLDDVRSPPDETWTVARTVEAAKAILLAGPVECATLDYELDICPTCNPGEQNEGGVLVVMTSLTPLCAPGCACDCHATGYDLCAWMASTGRWPRFKPAVHSAYRAGAARMRAHIDANWRAPA